MLAEGRLRWIGPFSLEIQRVALLHGFIKAAKYEICSTIPVTNPTRKGKR